MARWSVLRRMKSHSQHIVRQRRSTPLAEVGTKRLNFIRSLRDLVQVIEGIRERARAFVSKCSEPPGASIDVYVYLHCYALDCITHLLFHPFGTRSIEDPEDLKMMQELSYSDSLKARLLKYYSPLLSSILGSLSSPERVDRGSIADQYTLETCKKGTSGYTVLHKLQNLKEKLQEPEIASECSDHLTAGIDTTGDGLCFLMWKLSQPDCLSVQDRLREELVTNFDAAFDDLPYLDAVVKEGLRCFPPIPMSLPRYVPYGGRPLGGYYLPAGTIVSCQAFTLHRTDETVFPEPEKFVPERWLEKEGHVERNRLFFAFASGGRGCIGRNHRLKGGAHDVEPIPDRPEVEDSDKRSPVPSVTQRHQHHQPKTTPPQTVGELLFTIHAASNALSEAGTGARFQLTDRVFGNCKTPKYTRAHAEGNYFPHSQVRIPVERIGYLRPISNSDSPKDPSR
ncbi:hypothetical protein FGG08_006323 [Glutinoglossum americanum]|uniref:Cytochrome P450 n=1 Tax=Glutinoglossum americanum TaxID=1670608 RepID=A0A9P8L103_9PEZI|nr:hypothetical protein FGG08_006323 [Glutinoglossum americanum]